MRELVLQKRQARREGQAFEDRFAAGDVSGLYHAIGRFCQRNAFRAGIFGRLRSSSKRMLQQVAVITLGIGDLEASTRFYGDGFGWKSVFSDE
ncbi:hypothetical protein [Fulvimarina sp. MAC8]|uniref:hypothetical protein n=1 Tax=Fulvimarina sp. MAC8 TaxID=3162874 RepID=UPI0032EF6BC5